MAYPELSCTAIDARDPRALAEFHRELLGAAAARLTHACSVRAASRACTAGLSIWIVASARYAGLVAVAGASHAASLGLDSRQ